MVFSGVNPFALVAILLAVVSMTLAGSITLRCPCPWRCARSNRGNARGYGLPEYPNMIHERVVYPHPIVQMMTPTVTADGELIQF